MRTWMHTPRRCGHPGPQRNRFFNEFCIQCSAGALVFLRTGRRPFLTSWFTVGIKIPANQTDSELTLYQPSRPMSTKSAIALLTHPHAGCADAGGLAPVCGKVWPKDARAIPRLAVRLTTFPQRVKVFFGFRVALRPTGPGCPPLTTKRPARGTLKGLKGEGGENPPWLRHCVRDLPDGQLRCACFISVCRAMR